MRRGPARTRLAPAALSAWRVAPCAGLIVPHDRGASPHSRWAAPHGRRTSPGARRTASHGRGAAPCARPPAGPCAQWVACCAQWAARIRRGVARFMGAHLVAARSDRGSATVWSVGAVAVLCVVFGGVLAFGQAVVVRHRAAGGADLAALAAADHWAEGPGVACARAEEVARAQGTRLVRCGMVGETSDVTAASGRGPFTAEIRARAGPAALVPVPVPPGFGAPRLGGPTAVPPGRGGAPGPGEPPATPLLKGPRPPVPPAAAP